MNIFTRSLLLVTFLSFAGQEVRPEFTNSARSALTLGVAASIVGGGVWVYNKFINSEAKLKRAEFILKKVKNNPLLISNFYNNNEIYKFLYFREDYAFNWFLIDGYNNLDNIKFSVKKGYELVASVKDSPEFRDRKRLLMQEFENILLKVSTLQFLIINNDSYKFQLDLYNNHYRKGFFLRIFTELTEEERCRQSYIWIL